MIVQPSHLICGIPAGRLLESLYDLDVYYRNAASASVILVGSAGKNLRANVSDVDLRIVTPGEVVRNLVPRGVVRTEIDGIPVFSRQIFYSEISSLNGRYLSGFLWQASPLTCLRDDNEALQTAYFDAEQRFKSGIYEEIRRSYIRYRSSRNQYHSSLDGSSSKSSPILLASLCEEALILFSLLKGSPFPYKKWLFSHSFSLAKNPEEREFVDTIVSITATLTEPNNERILTVSEFLNSAFERRIGSREMVDNWWSYLTLNSM